MLAAGFLDEVRALRALPRLRSHPAPLDLPAIRAVGYRQAWEHLDGAMSAGEFRERAIHATRQLASAHSAGLAGRTLSAGSVRPPVLPGRNTRLNGKTQPLT